jgi:hypothetical protein
MKQYLCTLSLLILLSPFSQLYSGGSLGQSGANFLQIAVDPRGAALGGAVSAVSSGAPSLYWNPAGAVSTENIDVTLAYTDWFMDTKLTFGGAVVKLGNNTAVGLSISSFNMDKMEITTVFEPDGTGEYYNAGDLSAGLSFAHRMTDKFTFGITAKYINEYIWNVNASQLAVDIGSIYETGFMNLRLGMAVRNFGGTLKYSGENISDRIEEERDRNEADNPRVERLSPEFRLPQIFQMGVALDVVKNETNTVTVMADVDVPSDNEERMIFGSEYSFQNMAFLRAAIKLNYDESSFAFGGGLRLANFAIDYSFSDYGVFSSIHRFGVNFSL